MTDLHFGIFKKKRILDTSTSTLLKIGNLILDKRYVKYVLLILQNNLILMDRFGFVLVHTKCIVSLTSYVLFLNCYFLFLSMAIYIINFIDTQG